VGETVGFNPAEIPVRSEIVRRIFVPQSMMGNGIRSATPAIPRVSAEDAAPETSQAPTFPLVTEAGWRRF
jgi:hypothetical protein